MSTSIKHFSHPEHELILKENDVIEENATCCVCNKTVIGFPTYACSANHDGDDFGCYNFYLHLSCAELPTTIYPHDKHNQHPLTLQLRPVNYLCDVCDHKVKFAYACHACDFDLCVVCAFPCPDDDVQRALNHEGHQEHTLTLQRQALFKCDACWEEAKDFSYVCFTCDFWIHKKCAFSPPIIPKPTYHHHDLHLTYFIPEMHRIFLRTCNICEEPVHVNSWFYYCHKCTYFVHMKCAKSTISKLTENEAACSDKDPDLIEFPLHSEEALFDLLRTQCSKFQVDFEGVQKDNITISTEPNDPHIIEGHWSHPKHPLEQLQFIGSENDNNDNDDNTRVLLCDGCIQPISLTYPSYYGCIECGFYLHSVCATKLPQELPVGVSPFHSQHSLALEKSSRFYSIVQCGVCSLFTNGFYYVCETCDIRIDIYCAFLPARIKHKSHKHHPLVQRPSSSSHKCSVSKFRIAVGMEYACEICSNFQIDMSCLICPSTIRHKYDDHAITLRYPPFFYEGAFYCETCEEPVDNGCILFHCDECDHSFHYGCLFWQARMKLGGTIQLYINNQLHTLAFVYKWNARRNSPFFFCRNCRLGYTSSYFFECDGCGLISFHRQHSLALGKEDKFYELVECGACGLFTNGFYYKCDTCDIKIDICCAFMPARIKHKSHKHHPLVQRPSPDSLCRVSKFGIDGGMEYACEICSNFQIDTSIVSCPSTIRQKYDDHAITLRYPPFFYEGAFYCETCEEPVDNWYTLYNCGECDHSFHYHCLRLRARIKLGRTIELDINNQPHTLAFVYKPNVRSNSHLYKCSNCGDEYIYNYFFECDGCGYLICFECLSQKYGG